MKIFFGVVLLLAAGSATAQYRDSEPPVLSPPREEDSAARRTDVIAAFKRQYDNAKQPRVVLFWNRQLTDRISQIEEQKARTTGSNSASSSTTGVDTNQRAEKLEHSTSTTVNSIEVRDDGAQGENLDPRTDALLKTAFLTALKEVGVRLLDRTLAIRSTAISGNSSDDIQFVEMSALKNKAEWLLEIAPIRDSRTSLGYAFRASLKDIRNETLIMELYTPALPPPHRSNAWTAVDGGSGFQKAPAPAVTTSEVGDTLAIEVMGKIAASP